MRGKARRWSTFPARAAAVPPYASTSTMRSKLPVTTRTSFPLHFKRHDSFMYPSKPRRSALPPCPLHRYTLYNNYTINFFFQVPWTSPAFLPNIFIVHHFLPTKRFSSYKISSIWVHSPILHNLKIHTPNTHFHYRFILGFIHMNRGTTPNLHILLPRVLHLPSLFTDWFKTVAKTIKNKIIKQQESLFTHLLSYLFAKKTTIKSCSSITT